MSLRPIVRFAVPLFAAAAVPLVASCANGRPAESATQADSTWAVDAVRYGTLADFPVRGLVAGADSARRMDIALMVWVLRNGSRTVLVDAGFYRDKFVQRWKPADFVRPSDALAPLGIRPEDVTDIVVSHVHWDHLDGADLFPNARIWIQAEEYAHYVGADGSSLDRALDPDDAAMLVGLEEEGRVHRVDGDDQEVLPGIRAYTGGKHTFASQFLAVRTGEGTVVVASDNCYLYENLDRHLPIAQTLDSESNLAAQDRMRALAAEERLIVPGHDPAVFERFPEPGGGVARIAGR